MTIARTKQAFLPMTFWLTGVTAAVNDTPYVTLVVNPESKTENYGKLKNEHKVRHGYIVEHWGDELLIISMSGKTSGFYTKHGLTRFNAVNSESYTEFMKFFKIFLNNGTNWVTDPHSGQPVISTIGRVNISYDNQKYQGSFNSFTLTEEASLPFLFKYDFEFVVTHYEQVPSSVRYESF